MSLAHTGAHGDDSPAMYAGNWKEEQRPKMFQRFKSEYESIVKDHELLPDTVSVSWTAWDNESDKTMLPMQWTFVVDPWRFELVVRFPSEYPWKKPYYFVKTKYGTEVNVKQYLALVTMKNGPDGKGPKPGLKFEYDYIRNEKLINWVGQTSFSPAMTVANYIAGLIKDPTLLGLLQMAATVDMS